MAQKIHHEDTKCTKATKLTVIFVHVVSSWLLRASRAKIRQKSDLSAVPSPDCGAALAASAVRATIRLSRAGTVGIAFPYRDG